MVFQNYALYPHMTVFDNMAFSLTLARRLEGPTSSQEVDRAAGILGLGQLLGRYPRQLSGGQRQRVAMGRAIVRNPQVFLFDEPLSNLDAKLRVQMRAEIKDLHQRLKVTTVYVTHDQIEAMTMADKIVAMSDGNVEQIGDAARTLRHPTNLFVAALHRLAGDEPDEGRDRQRSVPCRGRRHAAAAEDDGRTGKAVYGIRPGIHSLSARSTASTRSVHLVEPMGSETQVTVRIGETQLVCTFRERVNVKPGDMIRVLPDRAGCTSSMPRAASRSAD